jgi:uncharacterized protein DUF3761
MNAIAPLAFAWLLTVALPLQTDTAQAPPGATARCRDGTYLFSRTRSGTCSRHGGVAEWLSPSRRQPPQPRPSLGRQRKRAP